MESETDVRMRNLRQAEQAVRDKYGRAAPSMLAGLPLAYDERLAALRRMAGGGGVTDSSLARADRSRPRTRED